MAIKKPPIVDETPSRIFTGTKGWKMYIDGVYGTFPRPPKIPLKRKIKNLTKYVMFDYWNSRRLVIGEKLVCWGARTLLYDICEGKNIYAVLPTVKFVIADVAARIGTGLYNGPEWWHKAVRARMAARNRYLYAQSVYGASGTKRPNGAYRAGDTFNVD